ncbi:MAG: hypothetical protein Q8O76_04200 [Chloroflexota bacterium]|nr:hypothetical protein [Chloroflexota bacterium]
MLYAVSVLRRKASLEAIRQACRHIRKTYPDLHKHHKGLSLVVVNGEVVALGPGETLPAALLEQPNRPVFQLSLAAAADEVQRRLGEGPSVRQSAAWVPGGRVAGGPK